MRKGYERFWHLTHLLATTLLQIHFDMLLQIHFDMLLQIHFDMLLQIHFDILLVVFATYISFLF
ncbi:TPA: hypothetical protein HA338_16530 [Methanosarcina acetivorans]|uniref:Uncharacterized protein n=1 Tax=Methanosarcina acetivorans TaxID=2214 RepID=A0A832WBT4_9EURY|nr:hypothetical protein [Methanosarcina acetivorans]HIH95540.1 hypothetical protein [Methanosarcina acetivorans]